MNRSYTKMHSCKNKELSLSGDKEANHSRLMTISEESEKRNEGEMHDEMKDNVEIHLKTEDDIINSNGYQETKLTVNKVERTEEVTARITKDKCSETTKFSTTYVNGQEV